MLKTKRVKLYIGSKVEVFSNSKQQWFDGNIVNVKIKDKLICVGYGPNNDTQKWLESTSKQFRPKIDKIQTTNEYQKSSANDEKIGDVNNKTKCKLRIGSRVEVFSVSKNQWMNGTVTKIKNDSIRIAYGDGLSTEKWLIASSKHLRPKLNDNYNINKNNDEHGDETNYEQKAPPLMPSYSVTHSLRRELYQQFSIDSIKGINYKRGDLKIKIHGALQLMHKANFTSITVAGYTLQTNKVKSDENPVWKEILTFTNYRPHIGKKGKIMISNKSAIKGEKIIGFGEFELPIIFNREEKINIDMINNKNKLSGIVVLEQCVIYAQ